MPHKTIINSILTEVYSLFFADIDSCVVSFIGFVNFVSFTFNVKLNDIIINPGTLIEHVDSLFNLLITILSFLILVRKYKKQK